MNIGPGHRSKVALFLAGAVLQVFPAHAQSTSSPSQMPKLVLQSGITFGLPRFAFSPDSRLVAAVISLSTNVVLWDTATGRQLRTLSSDSDATQDNNPADPGGIAFSPDGKLLAVSNSAGISIWDVQTGTLSQTIAYQGSSFVPIARLEFSPNGQLVAAIQGMSGVGIWRIGSGELVRTLPFAWDFTFSGDAEMMLITVGGAGTKAVLYDVTSGRELKELDIPGQGESGINGRTIARRGDGHILIVNGIGELNVWDVTPSNTSKIWQHAGTAEGIPTSLVLSPDAQFGALIDHAAVSIWDFARQKQLSSTSAFSSEGTSRNQSAGMVSAEFSPDHRLLALGDMFGDLRLVDAAAGREVIHLAHRVSFAGNMGFSADGTRLVFGNTSWDLTSGTGRPIAKDTGVTGGFASINGELFAGLDSKTSSIQVWNVNERRLLNKFSVPAAVLPRSISFSPDGTLMAATYMSAQPQHATAPKQRRPATRDILNSVLKGGSSPIGITGVYSPVAITPAAPDDYAHRVLVWDVGSGRQVQNLEYPPGTYTSGGAGSVYFSDDGHYLAIVPVLGNARILDVSSWKPVAEPAALQHGAVGIAGFASISSGSIKSAAFSPDGHLIAAAVDETGIQLPTLAPIAPVREKKSRGVGIFGVGGSMTSPAARSRTEMAAAPDLSQFSIHHSGPIKLFDTRSGQQVSTLPGHNDGTNCIAFNPNGKLLASASTSGEIKFWDIAAEKEIRSIKGSASSVYALSFSPDGGILASISTDGSASLWDVEDGSPIATLASLDDGSNWLVLTPDGLFDGSPAAWREILWRFGENIWDVSSIEMFFNEFYYPGLLGEIMAGKRPHAASKLQDKDRRTPQLSIERVDGAESGPSNSRDLKLKIHVSEAPAGAQDLRVFRNGSLVKVWHGDVLQGKSSATLESTIHLSAGENRITAYAFNTSNVKSEDAGLVVVGAESLRRKGHVFVVAVGIDEYANPDYNLKFASADARAFADSVKQNQEKAGAFDGTTVVQILDSQATRENILLALRDLAQRVQPEDAVLIFVASHGTASGGHFYLVPHDLGYSGKRTELNAEALQSILSHSVSDRDLEDAFQTFDVGKLLLVLDACNSGQALEPEERRLGPMNSKGLAQLAYEKGMYVLTASQSYQAAEEVSVLGHGLLTYALIEEGLNKRQADFEPKDGQILVREWIDYATKRVPEMQVEKLQQARKLDRSFSSGEDARKATGQQPRLFSPRETEDRPWVIAGP